MKLCLLPQLVGDGPLVDGISNQPTGSLCGIGEEVLVYRALDPPYARILVTTQPPSDNPSGPLPLNSVSLLGIRIKQRLTGTQVEHKARLCAAGVNRGYSCILGSW